MTDHEILRRYVERELDTPPGEEEARRSRFAACVWRTSSSVAQHFRIPIDHLRRMREAGVGPLWRPAGRRILYDVTAFREWISNCPDWKPPEPLAAIVRRFIDAAGPHGGWESSSARSTVYLVFTLWVIDALGSVPGGWRRELSRQITADPRFVVRFGSPEKYRRARVVEGWRWSDAFRPYLSRVSLSRR